MCRTIERDLSALGQAGLPLATKQGRGGGFTLDCSMTLPPLNFTSRGSGGGGCRPEQLRPPPVPARRAERPRRSRRPCLSERSRRANTADKVRLLVQRLPDTDVEVAEAIWKAVQHQHVLRIQYVDVGGVVTMREVEPQHVVVGPHGSYLTAGAGSARTTGSSAGPDHQRRADPGAPAPAAARPGTRRRRPRHQAAGARAPPEDLLPNSDIGLSRTPEMVGMSRRSGG